MSKTKKSTKKRQQKLVKEATKLVQQMGKQALYEARKQVLQDIRKLKSKQLKAAIRHMIKRRWRDYSRPALMMMVCEAVGGDAELTKEIAKGLILIAAAIDLHDDIIDKSETKHGEFTTMGLYGPEITLIAGDLLYVIGFLQIMGAIARTDWSSDIIRIIKRQLLLLADAEALEFEMAKHSTLPTQKLYRKLIRRKAADAVLYTVVPAIIAGSSDQVLRFLLRLGQFIGEVAIIADDYEDLYDKHEISHRFTFELPPLHVISLFELGEKPKVLDLLKKEKLEDVSLLVKEKGIDRLIEERCRERFYKIFKEYRTSFNKLYLVTNALLYSLRYLT